MIDWLFHHLRPGIEYVIRHPVIVFGISAALAAGGFWSATNLRIDNDLSKLIPADYPSVQALNTLREQVGGEHEAAVAIHSPSFAANKTFGEAFIPRALRLIDPETGEPFFTRAEFRRNIDFLKHNALYFATGEELDQLEQYLEDHIEESRREANPFYFELEEDEDAASSDSLAQKLNERYDELVGSEYTMSADSTILTVKLFPSGAQTDLDFISNAYDALDNLILQMEPHSYHPDMEVVAAGRLLRTLIEIQTITADVIDSFGAGVLMLLIAVVIYFYYKGYRARYGGQLKARWLAEQLTHTPAHALIMALPLVFSLCWTFGIAQITYDHLNIMTSTLGLLLFGMGIDFGIHFYARYAEERSKDHSVADSILNTFMTTGQAIFVVGLTTAAAFFILMIADFKGFSEFGFIAGIGLLFAIVSYLVFLPALIIIMERSPLLTFDPASPKSAEAVQEQHQKNKRKGSWYIFMLGMLAFALGLTTISILRLNGLSFEYHFSNLEPRYEEFSQRNRLVSATYSDRSTRNAAYIFVDTPREAPAVANILRQRAEADTTSPTIRSVETFQDRYPFSEEEIRNKLNRLAHIRELLNDPFLESSEEARKDLDKLKTAAQTVTPIPLDQVPDFLKAPFRAASGSIGHLVIIHPSVGLSDGRNSMAFADDVGQVTLPDGTTYFAGSTSIVASDMLRLMIDETPLMVLLTLIFIVVFKVIILRGIKWMVLALLPLVASFLWLFGIMELIGWKLNFYNLVVLPTILGIGDDSGIHMVHRYLEEGKGSIMRVLRSTGEHVTVSTLTTMLGFGGLLFSIHPGMRSIGEVAILGISLALFAAIFILPALLAILEKFNKKTHPKEVLRVKEPL